MFKSKPFFQTFYLTTLIFISTFLSNLEAKIQITTEFYSSCEVPVEHQASSLGGDLTLITIEGWPENSHVSITESNFINVKKCSTLKTNKKNVLCISSVGFIPGAPSTFTLKDSKHKLCEKITITPFPLFKKSQVDQARIEATLKESSPAPFYSIELTGFQKGEELIFQSNSHDEEIKHPQICSGKADINLYFPNVINQIGGIGKVSFTRPSGEVLCLELPWGAELLRYHFYLDENGKKSSLLENKEFLKKYPDIAKYFNILI